MSVPFGAPPPAGSPQSGSPQSGASQQGQPAPQSGPVQPPRPGGSDRTRLFIIVAAVVGAVAYVLGFFADEASAIFVSLIGFCLVVSSALAGLRLLPKAPNTLYAAAPLSGYAALGLLQSIVAGNGSAMTVVLLLLAIVQAGGVLGALLVESGIITLPERTPSAPKPSRQPPFGPPGPHQSGAQGQFGQPGGWNPQTGGHPQQPGQAQPAQAQPAQAQPAQSQPTQSQTAQPGHFGQQGGYPPATGGQPQQPGGWNPQSGAQNGASGGPQGTQQMPHPGQSREF